VQVSFREWQVPTSGSRPHDPLATPDGAIWYTGQMANRLGRLDPATGTIKEYPLETPSCALRSGDGEISDLGDSLGRRRSAQYDADARRQSGIGLQCGERHRAC
jgi:hypothetical protein